MEGAVALKDCVRVLNGFGNSLEGMLPKLRDGFIAQDADTARRLASEHPRGFFLAPERRGVPQCDGDRRTRARAGAAGAEARVERGSAEAGCDRGGTGAGGVGGGGAGARAARADGGAGGEDAGAAAMRSASRRTRARRCGRWSRRRRGSSGGCRSGRWRRNAIARRGRRSRS